MSLVIAIRPLSPRGTTVELECGHRAPLPAGQGVALLEDVPCEVCVLVAERERKKLAAELVREREGSWRR